jgi:hypothetical protein
MAERGFTMFIHAAFIGAVLYFSMVYLLKQSPEVAEDRSILLAAFILVYMVMFGHGAPTHINKNVALW